VRLAVVGDRSVRAVAQALGVRPDMLYQWKRQALTRVQQPVGDVFTGSGTMMSQDEEIRRLRRENATLHKLLL
jgi:transposase-like protein